MVNDDQCGHTLDDRDCAGDDAGIVPSTGSKDSRGAVVLGGFLWLRDGGWGFETDPEIDVLSVGDTALDTSAPVCLGGERPVPALDKHVVVFAARDLGSTETGTDLKRFRGGYRQHGVSQLGFKLVETRFSETRGDIPNDARDCSADRVLLLLCADYSLIRHVRESKGRDPIRKLNYLCHPLRGRLVGTPRRILVHLFPANRSQ